MRSKEGRNVGETEYWERVIMLSSKVREELEHHPSLLRLPSDVETVLLGATIRARERQKEGNLETNW